MPTEWLYDIRGADEDSLLELTDHLPGEAAEAFLELAAGSIPQIAQPVEVSADPFEHPDAQRRFRVMKNVDELERALDYPWEKWTVFLYPAQRQWMEKDYNGPARVSGQRIFQTPFSWKVLGVNIRGRSRTLHINYRTSHQIRMQADRLLGPEVSDVDGNSEERFSTISVFNGPTPGIQILDGVKEECRAVREWLSDRSSEGLLPHEIGVFVRSDKELDRARSAVEDAELPFKVLDENLETISGYVSISSTRNSVVIKNASLIVKIY